MKCSDKEWQHCQKEKRGCEGCAYNDEIAVGDYVRTNKGKIAQIKEIRLGKHKSLDEIINIYIFDDEEWTTDKYIVKHSKEIIDLIEENDFVNGKKVIKTNCSLKYIDDDADFGESEVNNALDLGDEYIYFSSEIESILTKELYNANRYVVKEELWKN